MTSGKFLNKIQQSVGKKGSENTEELSKALMEELNCETAFTIPVFGGIPIAESVVVTWIIMAVLFGSSIFLRKKPACREHRKTSAGSGDSCWWTA